MNSSINYNTKKYSKNMTSIAVLTAIFGIATVFLGYLIVPISAAFYATLLISENKNKRILSYILPVTIVFLDFSLNWVNGFFSEQSIAYVVLGLVLYFCYTKKRSKCECATLLTATTCIFMAIGLVFLGFNEIESPNFAALAELIKGIYYSEKNVFIEYLSSISSTDEFGIEFFAITREYAEELFHTILCIIPAIFVILAFAISGLAIKFFSAFSKNRIEEDEINDKWMFIPSTIFTYVYITLAILSTFASGNDIFTLTVINLNCILLPVFAYVGVKFIYFILSSKRGGFFAIVIIAAAICLLTITAIEILSYIGAYITLATNKTKTKIDQ